MDLVAWLFLIAFEGIVGLIAALLVVTYISFQRMERNVRRARMFIMADRIQRFLGAFTLGFVVLAATFASSFLGPIVRPRRTSGSLSFSRRSAISASADQGQPRTERTEDELHASR